MSPEQATDIIRKTLWIALEISFPVLLIAMVIGFSVSLFQSITQIQEMTLSFVPKILVFSLAISILFPWILKEMVEFSHSIFFYYLDSFIPALNFT